MQEHSVFTAKIKSFLLNPKKYLTQERFFYEKIKYEVNKLAKNNQVITTDVLGPNQIKSSLSHLRTKNNELFSLSCSLRKRLEKEFKNKFKKLCLRAIVHVPGGGAYYFHRNWVDGLRSLGIDTLMLGNYEKNWKDYFESFRPSFFIVSETEAYMDQFDWNWLRDFHESTGMVRIMVPGKTYDCDERTTEYRLNRAIKGLTADFYFFFGVPEFNREWLTEYFNAGFEVLSLPWSINPQLHYYVPRKKNMEYFFVGSLAPVKAIEAHRYLMPIVRKYKGLIAGLGFGPRIHPIEPKYVKYYYSSCEIAVNYHPRGQKEYPINVNDRTLIIPACGGFEIVDQPLILKNEGNYFFKPDEIVSASSSKEFLELFEYFLHNPEKRYPYIIKGMKRVYQEHTVYHRMEKLVQTLINQNLI